MRTTIILTLATLLLTACGGGGAGATPKESFEAWKSAMSSKDWDTAFELVPPSERAKAEKEMKDEADEIAREFGMSADDVKNMSPKELFGKILDKVTAGAEEKLKKLGEAEFVREEINDTRAKVFFKVEDQEDDVKMILEDGKWYVRFDF